MTVTEQATRTSVAATRRRPGEQVQRLLLPLVTLLIVAGGILWLSGARTAGDALFAATTVAALLPAVIVSVRSLAAKEPGVDVIAVLAMAGALLLGEWLAGAIIAVMLTGGEALETHAAGRARRELTSLLARAPRTAHVRTDDGDIVDVPVAEVEVGARLLVKTGEVVPTDGLLLTPRAVLDESALTGESRPTEIGAGQPVRSGGIAAGGSLEVRATTRAEASTYAGIVRLVEQAASERAPFVRMADRYATWFVGATLLLAAIAWAVSGDPVRALSVLVVATPCPLILAAPAAIVGGISNAARHGIIVKGGAAIEGLAAAEVLLFDKTGTITAGRPSVSQVYPLADLEADELLRLAGSLDQVSVHPFAPAIVAEATRRVGALTFPTDVQEAVGDGIAGRVGDHEVRLGQLAYVARDAARTPALRRVRRRSELEGTSVVHVAVDGRLAGALSMHDPIRPETPRALEAIRRSGIGRILMVTGDRADIAELVGETVGVDLVLAERSPEEKVDAVREARARGRTVMVGDGINDAPALALADTGIAMGSRGATAASEAADVVLTKDTLGGVADALRISRRTRRIAWQSVVVGMGLSVVAMVAATIGRLGPVAGALVQEGIDVLVLLNALRALTTPGRWRRRRPTGTAVTAGTLAAHHHLRPGIDGLGVLADRLDDLAPGVALERLRSIRTFLVDELLPHELEEERTIYPSVRAAMPGEDPTAPLARSHREIARRIRMLARLIDELPADGPDREDVFDLQRALWGLHAVLDLHVTLEDELYSQLPSSPPTVS